MRPYPVICSTPGCGRPATYKIAARWSDGATEELKTYGLACPAHVGFWYRRAQTSQAACRLTPGETLEPPAIFLREPALTRDADLEARLNAGLPPLPTA
jgi:hypothetical protein